MSSEAFLFDHYIAVDWSARNIPSSKKPTSDALWVGELDRVSGDCKESYFSTRFECIFYLINVLKNSVSLNKRVLIGYDLDFGFPAGFAKSLGLNSADPYWKQLWFLITNLITDERNNSNNRFQVAEKLNSLCVSDSAIEIGPLWGLPRGVTFSKLNPKSPTYPFVTKNGILLRKKRWTELREKFAQPVWKLIGSASVGGQTLTGIPAIYKLRFDPYLSHFSKIWPFETGFKCPEMEIGSPYILHVEIWPGILSGKFDTNIKIKDQAQVRATVEWFRDCDATGRMRTLLGIPENLSVDAQKECIEEEGWVLGSGLRW